MSLGPNRVRLCKLGKASEVIISEMGDNQQGLSKKLFMFFFFFNMVCLLCCEWSEEGWMKQGGPWEALRRFLCGSGKQ